MDRDSASQEKLRFGDNGLDKAEKVRKDNCEPGETQIWFSMKGQDLEMFFV